MCLTTVNKLCFIILAVMVHPLISFAQDQAPVQFASVSEESLLFQEIPSVYGASKFEQKVTQAPSSVSIVTSQDIKKNGYRTLADILRSVPGFYVTYDRNYSYVGVRGFGRPGDYNSRILLLFDGHRTNDNVFNQALVGTEAVLDVDLIDRVEIIRGPGSSLYGSNAFFGVINIITRRGRDLKGTEVSGEAGSFNTYKGRLSYGNRYQNGTEAIMSASAYDSKGDRLYYSEYDSPATNNGITNNTDYDRSQNLFSTVAFGDFTLQGAYSSRTKGIPTGAFSTDFNDPRNKTVDTRSYADLKYEHGMTTRTDLTVRLFYDYYHYTGDYLYSGVTNRDVTNGTWLGSEVKLSTRLQDMQRLIIGAEYQGSIREDQQNFNVDPYASYLDDVRRSRIMATYLQDEITFSKSLILNAGVRYDHYSTFGGTTNPRLALIATPAEKSTIKVLYGSAFRAPNDYELYYQVPGLSVANPDLKPEKITTTEVVYDQYFGDHLRASVSGYYYKIKDLINYGTDPVTLLPQFQNLDEVTAKGSEAELDGKWANGVEARISYTVQRTKDQLTGDPLTNSPGQMGKIVLNVPVIKEKLFLGVEEQYLGRRKTDAGGYASAFAITNLTLFSQNLLQRLEASVSIYNLFDKEYGDPVTLDFVQPTIRQDGRSYRFKLTYAF
jgi:outer membrane receptor for ferrienterochelin and colicins